MIIVFWLIFFVQIDQKKKKRLDLIQSEMSLVRFIHVSPGPEVIKLFSCSTQLSIKCIMLINVKMPTIVGILTFISMINTTSERSKSKISSFVGILGFYEQLKFHVQLS